MRRGVRRVIGGLLLLALTGCRRGQSLDAIKLVCAFSPSPPHAGLTQITLTLTDEDNKPVTHACVNLEGDMTRAGIVPTFGNASEVGGGVYRGSMDLTRPGDWVIIVGILTQGGGSVEKIATVHVVEALPDLLGDDGGQTTPSAPPPANGKEGLPAVDPDASLKEM